MPHYADGGATEPNNVPKDQDSEWGRYLGLGLEMGVGAGLGALVGGWLDSRYGWSPWGLLVGVMIGVAGGFYLLLKEGLRANRDDKK